MPSLSQRFADIVNAVVARLAFPIAGVVTSFDHKTHIATVRTTHRSGRGHDFFELPWILEPRGTFAADPPIGTHVIVAFRNGDVSFPYIQCVYDPRYYGDTRLAKKRQIATYTTRGDKNISSGL